MVINRRSSKQGKRASMGRAAGSSQVAGPVWPSGNGGTEQKLYTARTNDTQLYHNTAVNMGNVLNLFDSITQSTAQAGRIGNRIFVRRLRARMVLNNKGDRPNVSYRVAVTASPAIAGTDTYGELFANGGFTGVHIPQSGLLLRDNVFPLNQGSSMENNMTPNKERSFNYVLDVPINRPVVYNPSDGKASTALSVWIIAYDAYGTLTTDNIASLPQVTWVLDFTDA